MSERIYWDLSEPLKTAYIPVHDSDEERPLSSKKLNEPLKHFRQGDQVAVLYYDSGKVLYSEPIRGSGTVGNALKALERGLERTVPAEDNDLRPKVYFAITGFLRKEHRLQLVERYENGKLKFRDLLGDHTGFYTPFHRIKGGIFVYGLDS